MKILFAIMTCHAYRSRAQAQRETWVKDVPEGVDCRFFLGGSATAQNPDEVILDAPDDYNHLPLKVQAMRRWARERGYDLVLKLDDDVFVAVDRVLANLPTKDYVGRLRGCSGRYPAAYCSGFAYWMTAKAMDAMLAAEWNKDFAEDRFAGNVLFQAGILPTNQPNFHVVWSSRNALSGREAPRVDNPVEIAAECPPAIMYEAYQDYHSGKVSQFVWKQPNLKPGQLDRITIMIKTFLRDVHLFECLEGLTDQFPECRIVVVDDGYSSADKVVRYSWLNQCGHSCTWMSFDSGFGAKANRALEECQSEYVLIGSDDFNFRNPTARPGVVRLLQTLDDNPQLGVASGRVSGSPYESCLQIEGDTVREVKGHHGSYRVKDFEVHRCDLTVNYSLIRRKLFDSPNRIRWDEDVKIGGGEHGAFFLDVKRAGWGVAVVDGVTINELPITRMDPKYKEMRARARMAGRPCLKRRGINRWICQDGREELA